MTRAIVIANVAVYFAFAGHAREAVIDFGAVAAHYTGLPPKLPPPPPLAIADPIGPIPAEGAWWLRSLSHMFVHGGLLHLAFNMWFLWIFGDNIESRLGHARYLGFYLLGGLVALAAQVVAMPASGMPMVGASGAVAGVLGAYLVLYPHAKVTTLVPIGFFPLLIDLPAAFFLIGWLGIQVFSALAAVGSGVAWYAHIGGFACGALLVKAIAPATSAATQRGPTLRSRPR